MLVHGVIRRHGCYLPKTMYTNSISCIFSPQVINVASVIAREIQRGPEWFWRLIEATIIPSYSVAGFYFEYRKERSL